MNFGEASHVYTPSTDADYKYIEEALRQLSGGQGHDRLR